MKREMIVTSMMLSLLNDDEITINTFDTKFAILTTQGKIHNHKNLPLAELYMLFAEGRISTLWMFDYPRPYESEYGEPLEFLDDLLIFPQGIAHIEADSCSVEV